MRQSCGLGVRAVFETWTHAPVGDRRGVGRSNCGCDRTLRGEHLAPGRGRGNRVGVTASHHLTPSASLSLGIAAAGFPMFGAALAAGTGAIVWLAALGLSHLLPTAAPMSWAMAGDSAPHTALSIAVADAHGVTPAVLVNDPVPLLHVIIAEVGGERMVTSLRAAVGAMASTWAVLVALSSVMAGLVARELSRRRGGSRAISDFIALVGGILLLTWFVTGYPMKYGFVNSHLVLVLTLMVVAAALALRDAPWWSAVILTVSGTAVLVTWSPPVILSVPVFVVASVRIWMTRERPSRASGALFAVALGAAVIVGLVATVELAGNPLVGPWTYYPHKLAWQLTVTLLVIIVELAGGIAAKGRRGAGAVVGIVAGSVYGSRDRVYDEVVAASHVVESPRALEVARSSGAVGQPLDPGNRQSWAVRRGARHSSHSLVLLGRCRFGLRVEAGPRRKSRGAGRTPRGERRTARSMSRREGVGRRLGRSSDIRGGERLALRRRLDHQSCRGKRGSVWQGWDELALINEPLESTGG